MNYKQFLLLVLEFETCTKCGKLSIILDLCCPDFTNILGVLCVFYLKMFFVACQVSRLEQFYLLTISLHWFYCTGFRIWIKGLLQIIHHAQLSRQSTIRLYQGFCRHDRYLAGGIGICILMRCSCDFRCLNYGNIMRSHY